MNWEKHHTLQERMLSKMYDYWHLWKAFHKCHNHPSGNTDTSDADIKITRKIVTAGHFLDISVLDHVILTSESYLSMADEGILPSPNIS